MGFFASLRVQNLVTHLSDLCTEIARLEREQETGRHISYTDVQASIKHMNKRCLPALLQFQTTYHRLRNTWVKERKRLLAQSGFRAASEGKRLLAGLVPCLNLQTSQLQFFDSAQLMGSAVPPPDRDDTTRDDISRTSLNSRSMARTSRNRNRVRPGLPSSGASINSAVSNSSTILTGTESLPRLPSTIPVRHSDERSLALSGMHMRGSSFDNARAQTASLHFIRSEHRIPT